jgi:hypothetical protein
VFGCLRDGAKHTRRKRSSLQPYIVATLQVVEPVIPTTNRVLPALRRRPRPTRSRTRSRTRGGREEARSRTRGSCRFEEGAPVLLVGRKNR